MITLTYFPSNDDGGRLKPKLKRSRQKHTLELWQTGRR